MPPGLERILDSFHKLREAADQSFLGPVITRFTCRPHNDSVLALLRALVKSRHGDRITFGNALAKSCKCSRSSLVNLAQLVPTWRNEVRTGHPRVRHDQSTAARGQSSV